MNFILYAICGVALMLSGITSTNNNNNNVSDAMSAASKQVLTICEDDPIIMRGHVRTGAGQAIVGASVGLVKPGQTLPTYSTTSDSQGDYTLLPIPGSYTLKISATGYLPKSVPVVFTVDTERTDTLIAP
ncbi:MAG TPA: carboxypeptidase-like regulatory domain-containing protein [Bacteroidia bacterium]|nr:carboxypeptidase-like regulatory domain-containing protein [Bacteroidia bacterium]